ncbi:DnaJ domain [Dillenia turbinata]|uniref:DnaJ domain n=1 Tax=Dillenia turbinata TaxID=194707 RepID=A0AAN8VTF7_9MAGN
MGEHSRRSSKSKTKKYLGDTSNSPSSSSFSESDSADSDAKPSRRSHSRHKHRRRKDDSSRKPRSKSETRDRSRRHRRKSKHRLQRGRRSRVSESDESGSSSDDNSETDRSRDKPEDVARDILEKFPGVANDLKQLLQMIDDGQAVDIKELSERSLMKHLKKLFVTLKLKKSGDRVFFLPANVSPTLGVVGPVIRLHLEPKEQQVDTTDKPSVPEVENPEQIREESHSSVLSPSDEAPGPRRRVIGPEMPSAELLAAAARLTEAEAELRESELEGDTELFIGPPPPAVVAEAESANEAERFEEVTRIMAAEVDSPYDVLGVNHNMSTDNIKKKYWKLSLLVHPDKCSHPQAHQAFIILNKAFKDLQDPDKRKVLDDKIKRKEEEEEMKVELRAMREAAQWRQSQGISMEGDDELLAEPEIVVAPKREEWMTTLPPERKPGMTMQSTKFSRGSKEGRGDTSSWTDTPSDKAQKAKMNYLEAYNEATALASNEVEKKRRSSEAELVDKYNEAKRSKFLLQKHQEATDSSPSKRKSKQPAGAEKEDWVGKHPWKPWDREKDLTAGRQNVKFNAENMAEGLSLRFSSGSFQRNFL